MFKLASLFACVLIALLVLSGAAFGVGPWVMEWYALDAIKGTSGIAEGIDTDWLDMYFGMTEAEMSVRAPNPAITAEITIMGEEGDIAYDAGTYTVMSGGADIWGTADAFRFTYKELSGDFEIALKAESIEQTNDWAKIGPMIRQSTAPGSQYIFMLARALDGNKYFQERMEEGGGASGNGGELADAAGFPIWLKVTRSGDDFTGAISPDGADWTDLGVTTLALADPVLVGLAVTSHSTGSITTAVATNLTIDGVEPEFGSMTSEDIGIQLTETKELGWAVRNLGDVNDDRNLSNGIYEGVDGDMSNYVFYGYVAIESPVAQDTVVHVAQDDDAKIWLNGRFVDVSTGWTGGATITRPFDIHLEKGTNLMLIKVSEGGGGDYLNVQFDAEDLSFRPEGGVFDWTTPVSPEGKQSSTWGAVKSAR
jgi:hypothetical protein